MTAIKLLEESGYTQEERNALIDFILALKKAKIQELLERVELPKSGTKPDLRKRLQEALDEGRIGIGSLVSYLDSIAPWGKQHVFLYKGPRVDIEIGRASCRERV